MNENAGAKRCNDCITCWQRSIFSFFLFFLFSFICRHANNSDHDDFKSFTRTSKAHEIQSTWLSDQHLIRQMHNYFVWNVCRTQKDKWLRCRCNLIKWILTKINRHFNLMLRAIRLTWSGKTIRLEESNYFALRMHFAMESSK